MRILLLAHSFNSLTQRIYVELAQQGHQLAVELDINEATTRDAVRLFAPELVIAPFLKRKIPESVWRNHVCLIVHPGIPGDGGASALDRAILEDRHRWGVTVLQATGEYDAGPVWSWRSFTMPAANKSDIYRGQLTNAALSAVREAVQRYANGRFCPSPAAELGCETGTWRDSLRQHERAIDWRNDDTATIVRKIRSADGNPGVLDELAGMPCRIYDAHPEGFLTGKPGELIARRHHAVCRATRDGALWIGHVKPAVTDGFKLPATIALGKRVEHLPNVGLPFFVLPTAPTFQDIRYFESGNIGYLDFDFYNGAMATDDCRRLQIAVDYAASRPTKVIVLRGGSALWSNGMDLNTIEAAPSPADESWRNINAMDDLCEAIIRDARHLVIAALRGNAGAGGCFLALAADVVMARDGVVLNPHYQNMGNLYGSEYWTYLLPARTGTTAARQLTNARLPLGAKQACNLGLVDIVGAAEPALFALDVARKAVSMAGNFETLIGAKRRRRQADERFKPLSAYRKEELEHMWLNFYGFDPSYHVARYRFVHNTPHAWTPLYLAPHRRLGWPTPGEQARAIA